ncbi:MAG TPA: nucleotide exchange factor GrpE [Methanocorpusculum sp.]|nr:nucleotide exchange factor GrpE [Methanocorpusculum sp.]
MEQKSETTDSAEEISAEKKTMDAVPETDVVDETKEENPLEAAEKKYNDLNEKYLRLAAEYENFRKRSKRDMENTAKFATEKLALEMLEILDNFERAIKNEDENLREGLIQIHKFFLAVLSRNGIEKMNAEGQQFDPNLHEEIAYLPSDKPEGMIIDVAVPGYTMHDKVLRHAKVAVAAEKQPDSAE